MSEYEAIFGPYLNNATNTGNDLPPDIPIRTANFARNYYGDGLGDYWWPEDMQPHSTPQPTMGDINVLKRQIDALIGNMRAMQSNIERLLGEIDILKNKIKELNEAEGFRYVELKKG